MSQKKQIAEFEDQIKKLMQKAVADPQAAKKEPEKPQNSQEPLPKKEEEKQQEPEAKVDAVPQDTQKLPPTIDMSAEPSEAQQAPTPKSSKNKKKKNKKKAKENNKEDEKQEEE